MLIVHCLDMQFSRHELEMGETPEDLCIARRIPMLKLLELADKFQGWHEAIAQSVANLDDREYVYELAVCETEPFRAVKGLALQAFSHLQDLTLEEAEGYIAELADKAIRRLTPNDSDLSHRIKHAQAYAWETLYEAGAILGESRPG